MSLLDPPALTLAAGDSRFARLINLDVRQFGVVIDGPTTSPALAENTAKFADAVSTAAAAGARLMIPTGDLHLDGPISIPKSSGWQISAHGRARLVQHADNTPILRFTKQGTYRFTVEDLDFTWHTPQPVTNTAAIAMAFEHAYDSPSDNGAGFYNWAARRLRWSNGYAGISQADTTQNAALWGCQVSQIWHLPTMTGPAFVADVLASNNGQPNINLSEIYVRMDQATGPGLIIRSAASVVLQNVEFNNGNVPTLMEIATVDGLVLDGWRSEQPMSPALAATGSGLILLRGVKGGSLRSLQVLHRAFVTGTANEHAVVRLQESSDAIDISGISVRDNSIGAAATLVGINTSGLSNTFTSRGIGGYGNSGGGTFRELSTAATPQVHTDFDGKTGIGASPGFTLDIKGSHGQMVTVVNNAGYAIGITETIILMKTALTATRTVTLPLATGTPGRRLVIADAGAVNGANVISIAAQAGQTINGAATLVLGTAYAGVELVNDGSAKWHARVTGSGSAGSDGDNAWTPVFAVATDGTRRVLQVTDWAGGSGTKPPVGYLGSAGVTATIGDAIDIRGATGATGSAGSTVIDVTDYGAVGNSSGSAGHGTDNTTAFRNAYAAAIALTQANATVPWCKVEIYIPPGVYRVTDTIVDTPDVAGGVMVPVRGLRWRGDGKRVSEVFFDRASATTSDPRLNNLLVLGNRANSWHFKDMSFKSLDSDNSWAYLWSRDNGDTSFLYPEYGSGNNQHFTFEGVEWRGAWLRGLGLDGDQQANLNSEITWWGGGLSTDATFADSFLRIGITDPAVNSQQDQFLNYWFHDFKAEFTRGKFIRADRGGHIHIDGGSYIAVSTSNTNPVTFFHLPAIAGRADGTCVLSVKKIRFEIRNDASKVIDSGWNRGTISFEDCSDSAFAYLPFSNETPVHQYAFTGGGLSRGPQITYTRYEFMGYHNFVTHASTAVTGGHVKYDSCTWLDHDALASGGTSRALRWTGVQVPFRATDCQGAGLARLANASAILGAPV